jgi:hypothetical protein
MTKVNQKMKNSKFILGGTAFLLTIAGVYATKAAKTPKEVQGYTKAGGPTACQVRSTVNLLTGTKTHTSNAVLHTSALSGAQTVFTSTSCNTPYYTVAVAMSSPPARVWHSSGNSVKEDMLSTFKSMEESDSPLPHQNFSCQQQRWSPHGCLKNSSGLATRFCPGDAAGDDNLGSLELNRLLRLELNS